LNACGLRADEAIDLSDPGIEGCSLLIREAMTLIDAYDSRACATKMVQDRLGDLEPHT
jgi:hypothetical protein